MQAKAAVSTRYSMFDLVRAIPNLHHIQETLHPKPDSIREYVGNINASKYTKILL